MDGMIKCPVCGENNSNELDYCQKCNSRLRLQDESLKPGELPDKKKNTAELEPILPQWLRDAREQSRQTSQDDLTVGGLQQLKPRSPVEPPASNVDLLAGLQSHAGDDTDDETPDWLASITGVSNKTKKAEPEAADVHRVEMGGKDDFARDADNETPSWLASIQSQPKTEKDELTDWFKEASNSADDNSNWLGESTKGSDPASEFNAPAASNDTPDWLRQMQTDESAKNESIQAEPSFNSNDDSPAWLNGITDSAKSSPIQASQAFDSNDDSPDWLKNMRADDSAADNSMQAESSLNSDDDTPDWLKRMDVDASAKSTDKDAGQAFSSGDDLPAWLNTGNSQEKNQQLDPAPFAEPIISGNDAGFSSSEDTPDWLKRMEPEEPKVPPLRNTSPLWLKDNSVGDPIDENVPAWLSSDAPVVNQPPAMEAKKDEAEFGDIPNWLKAAAPQSSIFSEPAAEPDQTFSSDTPDWLSTFKSVDSPQPSSPFANEVADDVNLTAPAFTESSFESGNDALFTEMPDWLSNTPDAPTADAAPAPIAANNSAETIAASELPSWVQAMRPVENSSAQSASFSSDQTLESRGALSGLQGVLPSVPGYTPSSKPKSYSILLQATEEQKSHALLLEQILSAETEPQPIASYLPLAASRPLRWFIAFAVLALISTVLALHTTIFSMPFLPVDTQNEMKGALDVAQNVPEGKPVLVVMDYRPSHAAELEAAAAPMLDQMDLLRHPKLVFVSTNEMGSVLAERLLSLPSLKDRYRGEGQFINLGYLPGGELGIRAFAQSPSQTMPLDVFQKSSSTVLEPVSIVQFTAVIVLTDNADSGRIWIEQATAASSPLPFPSPIVLITSAQAGPMLQPYYVSGQVKGIINGLYGAAIFEQNNAGRPGTARSYWDAYSLGILLAMLMLILGGLWNLALGTRDRSVLQEGN